MGLVGCRFALRLSAAALCFGIVAGCGDTVTDDGMGGAAGTTGSVTPPPSGTPPPAGGSGATPPPSTTTPTAGAGSLPPVGGASAPVAGSGAEPPTGLEPVGPAMDECGLDSGNLGDEYCILPPSPDKGFQLHIGPSDLANPDPMYVLEPGEESTDNFSAVSGNTEDVYFYYRQFRMRPGAHHNIITTSSGGGGFDTGRRLGTTNHLSEDSPKGGMIAPENEGVGIPLAPNSPINVSLHSINTTDKPLIREMWVNFWYRDPAEVTEPVEQMFQTGDVTFMIQPGQDTILGPFNCTLQGDGRMLWLYGHRHANTRRFSAWRVRGGQRDLIYEAYNWEEPLVLEYASTVVNNTMPNETTATEGGWSGVLDFQTGDQIEWECHVVNQTDGVLRFSNNTYTGEMCIVDAELVGTNCGSGLPFGG